MARRVTRPYVRMSWLVCALCERTGLSHCFEIFLIFLFKAVIKPSHLRLP